eukprot:727505-Pleurochrysis_carterae.AAC.1
MRARRARDLREATVTCTSAEAFLADFTVLELRVRTSPSCSEARMVLHTGCVVFLRAGWVLVGHSWRNIKAACLAKLFVACIKIKKEGYTTSRTSSIRDCSRAHA